jgi:hypothetical protein
MRDHSKDSEKSLKIKKIENIHEVPNLVNKCRLKNKTPDLTSKRQKLDNEDTNLFEIKKNS